MNEMLSSITGLPVQEEQENGPSSMGRLLDAATLFKMREDFARFRELMAAYRCAMLEVETKFRVLNEQLSLSHAYNPIQTINSRLKTPDSIRGKLKRRNLLMHPDTIEKELFDIAGIRVICSFRDDIYMLADCLLQQDDVRLIQRKDYIAEPKENGYRSLHLVVEVPIFLLNEKRWVKVEVQLRTIAMEFWANLEHKLRYKKDLPADMLELTSNELLECAELSAALDLRMQRIRDVLETSEEKE